MMAKRVFARVSKQTLIVFAAGALLMSAAAFGVMASGPASATSAADATIPEYDVTWEDFDYTRPVSLLDNRSNLPEELKGEGLGINGLLLEEVYAVGSAGNADFWVALDEAGYICLVGLIPGEDWVASSACQSPEGFNSAGMGLRFSNPYDEVEAYVTPDSGVISSGVLSEQQVWVVESNFVAVNPTLNQSDRTVLSNDISQAGGKLTILPMNTAESDELMEG